MTNSIRAVFWHWRALTLPEAALSPIAVHWLPEILRTKQNEDSPQLAAGSLHWITVTKVVKILDTNLHVSW
jgi:hypothetical protein